jgi:uncharacterized protein YciI
MEKQGLRDHFFYLRALHEKQAVLAAVPFGPEGGLVILRVPDQAAATEIVAEDPAVISGVFVGEVTPFLPRIASGEPFGSPTALPAGER